MLNREMKCMVPGCDLVVYARGLCRNHGEAVKRLVRSGEAEEEDLLNRGLLLESRTAPRGSSLIHDLFLKGSKVKGRMG